MKLIGLLAFLIVASVATAANDYNEWVKHFYQTQDVAPFDGYWQMVLKDRMLENRNQVNPIIGFSSQVFHSHPSLIKGHIDNLASFPKAEREPVLKLLWLSDTEEAREILSKAGSEYSHKALPPIGTWKIITGQDLDLCWGWFFATGDVRALDPIVAALDFGKYAGALKRYKTSQQTEEDKQAAFKDAIFGAAMWSLGANGSEDSRIAKHIKEALLDPQTPKSRKLWLSLVFAKTSPSVLGREDTGGIGAAIPPSGVIVAYALVPKDRLSDAVKGRNEALEIEDAWRKEMMSRPHYPMNLANEKYSIVVFVDNPPTSAIWGRMGIPIQNPSHPVVLNVSLAPGYYGTYVIDGGGLILFKIPPEPKPYKWLEVHSE